MTGLALRSLAHRRTAFIATLIGAVLGSAVIGSFATLGTAATGSVSSQDRGTLLILAGVVGGWGAIIVLFSVVSTAGITVRQRHEEIALLRTVGSSENQVRTLVRREAGVVLALGAVVGAAIAAFGGRALLSAVRGGGLVSDRVSLDDTTGGYATVLAAPVAAAVLVTVVGVLAAGMAARRISRDPALHALASSRDGESSMRPWRWIAAIVCVGYAISLGVMTVASHSSDPYDAMSTSGSCSLLVAIGLAAVSPVLLRFTATVLRPFLGNSPAGHLASFNTERRANLLSSVLGPVIVLTSAAVGTLTLIGIDNRTGPAHMSGGDRSVNVLNYVIVGMLSLFAAITVINAFAAATSARREEFARLSVLGAEAQVVRRSVTVEAWIVAAAGVVFGVIASLATTVPFGIARHEGVVPDGQLWVPPLIVVGVVALTVLAARASVARVRLGTADR